MNRTVLALALGLLAVSPAPATLVAGSVRDQHGAPIAGASVSLAGTSARTTTQADGTFVIRGNAAAVVIRCEYCRTQRADVGPDGTVVAIVQRYDAVRLEAPSPDDLARLPYARIESALSLTPFVVLTQSSGPLPGASLHDASLSTPGGLLAIDGVPDYDSAAGVSTFGTLPSQASDDATVMRAGAAYTYGDLGLGGTYNVDTAGGSGALEGGADTALRVASASPILQNSAAYSNWDLGDRRTSASAQVDASSGQTQAQLSLYTSSASDGAQNASTLGSSFSALRFSLERTQTIDSYATIAADRGSDGYASPEYPFDDTWSDVSAAAGVRSDAAVAPFAELSARDTHGWMWSPQTPDLAGTIDQTRALTGVSATAPWYSATAATGWDQIGYDASTLLGRDETFTFDVQPVGGWTLSGNTTAGYAIEPLFESYEYESAMPVQFQNQNRIALGYGDEQRVRIEALAVQTRSNDGVDDTGNGFDLAWQVAPSMSLRTWWLNVRTAAGSSQQVGSAWATFTPGSLRFDLIWRRDLLNGSPDAHVDASLSGPLTGSIGWFVRSEERLRARATDAGITF